MKKRRAWNYGLSKETDERVAKYANTKRGKPSGIPSPIRRYSVNAEDWVLQCSKCNCNIHYKSRDGYANAVRRLDKGVIPRCSRCRQLGRVVSDDSKMKMSRSARERWGGMTKEAMDTWRQIKSEHSRQMWSDRTPEERYFIGKKITDAKMSMPDDKKMIMRERMRQSRLNQMKELGIEDIFVPGYNRKSIHYIDTVLNEQYGTKFRHAENGGEFRVWDPVERRSYYADAYSENLNLWIEIDETYHYDTDGNLRMDDIYRQRRIEELLGCTFKRIQYTLIEEK